MTPEARREFVAILDRPSQFAEYILEDSLWWLQRIILDALMPPSARVAVGACHSSGKTRLAADAAVWWLQRSQTSICITTAPSWAQVETQMWKEIHSALARSQLAYPAALQTRLVVADDRWLRGLSTNQGVRFQGHHGSDILIIMDEAIGILPHIWEAIEGIRAGGDVRQLALANPTDMGTTMSDILEGETPGWDVYRISAFLTPNLAGLGIDVDGEGVERLLELPDSVIHDNPRSYLTTRSWVRDRLKAWGTESPEWDSRVLGRLPRQSVYAIYPTEKLHEAGRREVEEVPDDQSRVLTGGIDVAGPGDDLTVVALRYKDTLHRVEEYAEADPFDAVCTLLEPYREALSILNVDAIGIGYNFALRLRDQGFPVRLVNVAEKPRHDPTGRFTNLRAEMFWGFRDLLMQGRVVIAPGLALWDTARRQFAAVRYVTRSGKIAIEEKDQYRKRAKASPDHAEAILLAYLPPLPETPSLNKARPVVFNKDAMLFPDG